MEVKPGYKQTEVGVIPNDWSVRSVGDVCGFIVPGRNKPRHFNGEIPWVTTPDLEDGRSVSASRVGLCVTRAEAHTIGSRVVPVGSVLMSCAGDLGITAITRNEIVINQQLHAFIPSPQVNAVFLLNVIASQKPQIAGLATKTAVPYLNKNNCNSIHIPVPPVAEQEAIAAALSDADALIESLEQLLAKKRHLEQGAMQELLSGKKRLPGFSGEWEVKRLGEICEVAMGRTPPRLNPEFWGRGHTWLSIADLRAKVVTESKEEITALAAAEMQVIPNGTLLMSFKLSIGRLCFAGRDLYTNEAICSFNKLRANADFLYYVLGRTDFSLYGKQAVKGYTLNSGSLKLIEVHLPAEAEQLAIAAILSDMDAEITALEDKLAKAGLLKQGMMQELLTGRIRLV